MTDKKALSKAKKVLLGIGAFTLLAGIVGATNSPAQKDKDLIQTTNNQTQVKGDSTAAKPKVEIKTVEERTAIPYQTTTQNDNTIASGQTSLTPGVNGEKIITYEVTYTAGQETSRRQVSEQISTAPVNEIKRIGTKVVVQAPKPKPNCDPNYSGACVPIASDVDCAGGSGNGPAYVSGPVYVTGSDIYGLDRDGDGVACE
jgi:hypothetical protein